MREQLQIVYGQVFNQSYEHCLDNCFEAVQCQGVKQFLTKCNMTCRLEGAVAESKRLQAKIVFVEGELKLAQDELAGQKSQADIDVQTKAQHAELLRKVEQINVLTDSNRMLRQEKDSLQPKIDSLDKQVWG